MKQIIKGGLTAIYTNQMTDHTTNQTTNQLTNPLSIFVFGTTQQLNLVQAKVGQGGIVKPWDGEYIELAQNNTPDLVINFAPADGPILDAYTELPSTTVIMVPVLEHALHQMACMDGSGLGATIVGFNPWPDALAHNVIEVSAMDEHQQLHAKQLFGLLSWDHEWVADQVGLVTPRVIGMVINEAYLMLQEGSASRQDIDTSMRLGVNYPYGPFEWATKIGLANVLHLLDSLWHYTHDPRYQASLLMRREAASLKIG